MTSPKHSRDWRPETAVVPEARDTPCDKEHQNPRNHGGERVAAADTTSAERSGRTAEAARVRALIAAGERVHSSDQRAVTAEHEAAHAVTYIAMGCGFHHAEIEPRMYTASAPGPTLRDVWTVAVVSIAGVVVEDSYRPRPLADRVADAIDDLEDDPEDAGGDMAIFGRLPELAEPTYRHAALILSQHAAEHAEIADALYSRGRLTRDEVAALPLSGALLARMEALDATA